MFSDQEERLKRDFNISTFQTLVVSVVIIINVTYIAVVTQKAAHNWTRYRE